MNPEPNQREQWEVRLIALLLGEASSSEQAELRRLMEQDSSLAAFYAEMQQTVGMVKEAARTVHAEAKAASQPVAQPKLSPERRAKLLEQFKQSQPKAEVPPAAQPANPPYKPGKIIFPNFIMLAQSLWWRPQVKKALAWAAVWCVMGITTALLWPGRIYQARVLAFVNEDMPDVEGLSGGRANNGAFDPFWKESQVEIARWRAKNQRAAPATPTVGGNVSHDFDPHWITTQEEIARAKTKYNANVVGYQAIPKSSPAPVPGATFYSHKSIAGDKLSAPATTTPAAIAQNTKIFLPEESAAEQNSRRTDADSDHSSTAAIADANGRSFFRHDESRAVVVKGDESRDVVVNATAATPPPVNEPQGAMRDLSRKNATINNYSHYGGAGGGGGVGGGTHNTFAARQDGADAQKGISAKPGLQTEQAWGLEAGQVAHAKASRVREAAKAASPMEQEAETVALGVVAAPVDSTSELPAETKPTSTITRTKSGRVSGAGGIYIPQSEAAADAPVAVEDNRTAVISGNLVFNGGTSIVSDPTGATSLSETRQTGRSLRVTDGDKGIAVNGPAPEQAGTVQLQNREEAGRENAERIMFGTMAAAPPPPVAAPQLTMGDTAELAPEPTVHKRLEVAAKDTLADLPTSGKAPTTDWLFGANGKPTGQTQGGEKQQALGRLSASSAVGTKLAKAEQQLFWDEPEGRAAGVANKAKESNSDAMDQLQLVTDAEQGQKQAGLAKGESAPAGFTGETLDRAAKRSPEQLKNLGELDTRGLGGAPQKARELEESLGVFRGEITADKAVTMDERRSRITKDAKEDTAKMRLGTKARPEAEKKQLAQLNEKSKLALDDFKRTTAPAKPQARDQVALAIKYPQPTFKGTPEDLPALGRPAKAKEMAQKDAAGLKFSTTSAPAKPQSAENWSYLASQEKNADKKAAQEGGLVKAGAGVLTLSGATTFSGGTVISGGVLELKREADVKKAPPAPPLQHQPEYPTRENRFSTFSLNISDVAFKTAAASLNSGELPDPNSIRTEEFINAFNYHDPAPAPRAKLAFAWERAHYPFAHNRDIVRFSVQTAAQGRDAQKPLNLVVLLDNSGSMERPDRVQIVHEAMRVLAKQLQPQDRISVVAFARTARLSVDGLAGGKPEALLSQVLSLVPEGGTDLEAGLDLAYATVAKHFQPKGNNRVILLTDGAANLGNVEPEDLKSKVVEQRKKGIALDCFGIGWEEYNDDLLELLSRNADGRYAFLNQPDEAGPEFANKLAGALNVAASDVKTQVEFNPQRVTVFRQVGYAKHQLTKEQFRDNTVDAAEIAAAEAGNALYVIEVNPQGQGALGVVRVRYKDPETGEYLEKEWELSYQGQVPELDQASPAMRLATTAGAFGEWLARNPYADGVRLKELPNYLTGIPEGFSPDPRPKQLVTMIRQAIGVEGK